MKAAAYYQSYYYQIIYSDQYLTAFHQPCMHTKEKSYLYLSGEYDDQ